MDNGEGMTPAPCRCDVWLENATYSPLKLVLTLDLNGNPSPYNDVEVQDPGGAFYAVWSKQVAIGAPITVMRNGDLTVVRPEPGQVTLDSVVMPACSLLIAHADTNEYGNVLVTHADFLDATGNVVLTADGSCRLPHL